MSKQKAGPAFGGLEEALKRGVPKAVPQGEIRKEIDELKAVMDRAGVTTMDMARLTGISASSFYRWLQGRTTPSAERWAEVKAQLGEFAAAGAAGTDWDNDG